MKKAKGMKLYKLNKEVQLFEDKRDVQLKKLRDDLKIYQAELKRAKFVYENYEREVNRLRKETEKQEQQPQEEQEELLQIPRECSKMGFNTNRSTSSCKKSRSVSRKSNIDRPFKRISKRGSKHNKENKNVHSNLNIKQSKNRKKGNF